MNAEIRATDAALKLSKGKSTASRVGVKKDLGKEIVLKTYQTLGRAATAAKSQQKLETINEESSSKGVVLYRTAQTAASKKVLRGQSAMEPDSAVTDLTGTERRTASQMSTRKAKAAKPEWQLHYERQRKRKTAA